MDDFSISNLHESTNEWSARLITILTPFIIDGLKSILKDSVKACIANKESNKYLMAFQIGISHIHKWNNETIENKKKQICEKSGCNYLEDLITCVHILQLKILTIMRVGQKQKKIDIDIPKINDFIHKVYINVARKIFKNVYLFEINIDPLQIQKHDREIEIIVQECILTTIRENISIEEILRAYMNETTEEYTTEDINEEIIPIPINDIIVDDDNNTPKLIVEDINDNANSMPELVVENIVQDNNELENLVQNNKIKILPDNDDLMSITSINDLNDDITTNVNTNLNTHSINITDQQIHLQNELNDLSDLNTQQQQSHKTQFVLPDLLIDDIEQI
jgi:hypothetical protein